MCSDFSPGGHIPIDGNHIAVDPQVVDALHGDFHLKDLSPVRSAADPAATTAVDIVNIDGEARLQGPRREMGAGEIK
jgi:hypothetical protein